MAENSALEHASVDWSKWEPAGKEDVRSPCPFINTLANHHIFPHDGRGITKKMAVDALIRTINFDKTVAGRFYDVALRANPDPSATSLDLDHLNRHGIIEHDVSLSRNDASFGDNHSFDGNIWKGSLEAFGHNETIDVKLSSIARYNRMLASKKAKENANMDFGYGIKEMALSYGESALYLSVLGDAERGQVSLEYLRVLIEQERIPYEEGWRPSRTPITQGVLNGLVVRLMMANEHKEAEALEVGMGTVHAVENAVMSFLPHSCTIM